MIALAAMGPFAALRVTVEVVLALAARHPIHSSSARITVEPGAARMGILLRVFADDYPPGTNPTAIEKYLAARFRITDGEGKPVPLRLDSVRVEGLVVVSALSAPAPRGLSGYRIWHGVLSERYPDQVNIVQASYGGRSVSLLFTASDTAKSLP